MATLHRLPTARLCLVALILSVALGCERAAIADDETLVTVYKSPTCGCCKGWIKHLEAAGFRVAAHDTNEMSEIKDARGIPRKLGSCHTAEVGGYLIEGHVPPADIQRLLREKPAIAGLAVPGMPIGSPGMEGPDPEAYDVIGFREDGNTAVYSTHGP